jgi:hypothetical protein
VRGVQRAGGDLKVSGGAAGGVWRCVAVCGCVEG